jgi:hypothetical protein
METTTLNALLTFTFFAPMALMVAVNLLTHRTLGPKPAIAVRRIALVPTPPKKPVASNEPRYLEAA